MEVVILAGGRGTRAYPLTADVPKPMLWLKGMPLVERVMRVYARQGYTDFILCVGHRKEVIQDYFYHRGLPWRIRYSDAGDDAGTGGRILATRDMVTGPFFATYGDGLGNVDLSKLLRTHREHDGVATLTAVPMRSQYGTVEIGNDSQILGFEEKPLLPDMFINAGYFVFDPELFTYEGDSLEADVLTKVAANGGLYAYKHEGFWKSVDTFKDLGELEDIVAKSEATWTGS